MRGYGCKRREGKEGGEHRQEVIEKGAHWRGDGEKCKEERGCYEG